MPSTTSDAMSFIRALANEETSQLRSEDDSPRTKLQNQLSALSFGSGIFASEDMVSKDTKKAPLGTPPKAVTCILPGAFFAESAPGSMSNVLDMSESQQKEVSPVGSPLASATRSRNGSTNSQRYVPPKGKYSSEQPRDSDQQRFKQWLSWDNSELEKRKRALIGKTVVGKLSPQRGNRYFVKWNINANDTIVISADKVEEVLGAEAPAGMWVSCTIVGLGPGHVQWNKQHPYAMTLESRETRASHQPNKGKMPAGSPHWKKSQKAGLTREVTAELDQRRTVPAEIDMARYVNARNARQVPEKLPMSISVSMPPPATVVLTSPPLVEKGIILSQTVPHNPNVVQSLGVRTNGANINLVTGEVRQRGRADTAGSWRKRDRSFTV